MELRIDESSKLCNVVLSDLTNIIKCKVLVCAVLRAGNAIAPKGNFVLQKGDRVFVTAPTDTLAQLLKNLGVITRGVNTEIPGGDSTFQEGDTVVVVTSGRGVLKNINDIFA